MTVPTVAAPTAPGAFAAYATYAADASHASHETLGGERETARARRGAAYVETRLFFGTERPGGGPEVTERQFMAFVDRRVTPDFPAGLTIQRGHGQWRDANGVIERERSYELILLYPAAEAPSHDARIERIRDAYTRAYGQESVARLDEGTRADF